MTDVLVLGAGVVGMATAYCLARQGHGVTVIDKGPSVAADGASFGNGAQLSYCYTDALASPSLARKLPKFMLGLDEAFRWGPSPNLNFCRWTAAFLANMGQSSYERNTLAVMALAFESRQALAELQAEEALDFQHRRTGKIHILPSRESIDAARHMMDLKNSRGASQSILTVQQALEREPALTGYGSNFAGAMWSPLDELGDPVLFCEGLKAVLEAKYGVRFLLSTEVESFQVSGKRLEGVKTARGEIRSSKAVLALGMASRQIAAKVGIRLPIWPLQGYSLTVPATDRAPTASITDTVRKMVFCRIGDRLRVAGLADMGLKPFRPHRFDNLVRGAREAFPEAGDYSGHLSEWTGYRPTTPTSQPLIGATPVTGLYLNCGHGSLGWTLAMGSGRRVASLLESGRTDTGHSVLASTTSIDRAHQSIE